MEEEEEGVVVQQLNKEKEEEEEGELRELLASNPDDSSLHFQLGVCLWDKGDQEWKEKAAEHFLASAKLDPLNAPAFKFLGHFYSHPHNPKLDSHRAIKCYQRAISLVPHDSDSGEALCDLLDHAAMDTLQLAVCKDASQKSPRAFWAFRRLGYLQVHQQKWSDAVQSLQHAIRGYPTCADLWEALGLAYQQLGMFTAAVKSYGRAIELENTRVFALTESGNVFLMLGSFRKGIEIFQQALEIMPESISALYGLATGLLGLSKECIRGGALKWGASLLEEAFKVAKSSTCLAGNMSCLWKLVGDIQLACATFLPWIEEDQSLYSDVEAFRTSIYTWKKARLSAAKCAKSSYQRALLLAPWQAYIYADIAIISDYVSYLNESLEYGINSWTLSEKMALGALLLECDNHEFWVMLGCLSDHTPLKQHALIRGLQLDVSLAEAWAYLGKFYREEGEKKLARKAFDCARSIDPSLALPWAAMSADFEIWEFEPGEAFESCLRAVQTLPLAEFQLGLAKLALVSGNLSSSLVFGAIQQAVQHAPHCPESYNLNGLAYEALSDYQSAVTCYRLAHLAIKSGASSFSKLYFRDISINLARSLSMGGNVLDAVWECESMDKEGLLDAEGLQIYAFSLWKLGRNDLALSIVRNVAGNISSMEHTSKVATVSFICRLLYYISGPDSAITSILKMPKEFFQSSKVCFVVSAIHALDQSNRLESFIASSHKFVASNEENVKMHFLMVLGKLIKQRSEDNLGFKTGVVHLRKALHIYPNSSLIRNLLGNLLLSSEEWNDVHAISKCCTIKAFESQSENGLKSALDILGAGAVACYAVSTSNPRFSFPTCKYQGLNGPSTVDHLQKSLRQEPWKRNTRFLLILNLFQKAREERYPPNLCLALQRLIYVTLSNGMGDQKYISYQHEMFQLLICASEISLQSGNYPDCISHAKKASTLVLPECYLFFAHLLLSRAYASEGNLRNAKEEYKQCLDLKTEYLVGWACLKLVECQYRFQTDLDLLGLGFEESLRKLQGSQTMWMASLNLVRGLASLWNRDYILAECFFSQACSLAGAESCLSLCHGSTCMELARQLCDSQFLSLALSSLPKAQENSAVLLPIVSILLAQAQGSLGSKEKWETNLRYEWCSWPPEMRPAELFFQMHLLARESKSGPGSVEFCQSPRKWVLRAIHVNPSCSRYWKALQMLMQ